MREIIARVILTAPFTALALAAAPAMAQQSDNPDRGEAELAEMLEGRVAGEPVDCLRQSQRDGLRVVDDTALVFRDGNTLYVNRPNGANLLSWHDIPVFEPFGTRLCRLDRVELRDRTGFLPGPVLFLGEFVPYRRVEDAPDSEGG